MAKPEQTGQIGGRPNGQSQAENKSREPQGQSEAEDKSCDQPLLLSGGALRPYQIEGFKWLKVLIFYFVLNNY